jgi:hypothetical protein
VIIKETGFFGRGVGKKKLGLSPERTGPSKNRKETGFFGRGVGKKLALSPERTGPSKNRKETGFFGHGVGKKNSVSPLSEPGHRKAEKRPSFSGMAWVKKTRSLP